MSRFSGKQYPGAMKDYRAVKREEALARQAKSDKQTGGDAGDALFALASFIATPFVGAIKGARGGKSAREQGGDPRSKDWHPG